MAQHIQEAAELFQNLTINREDTEGSNVDAPAASPQEQQSVGDGEGDGEGDGDVSEESNGASLAPSTEEGSPGASDYVVDSALGFSPNGYSQQAVYYGCHDGSVSEYEEFPGYVNLQGTGVSTTGAYGNNCSALYHTGYGYSPQMPYGAYSPAGTTIPNMRGDGQVYGSQHYQYPVPLYQQQPVPLGTHYIPFPSSASAAGVSNCGVVDQQNYNVDGHNGNGVNGNSSTPAHLQSPYGRGILPLSIHMSPSYQDPSFGVSAAWSDSPNNLDCHQTTVSMSNYSTTLSSSGSFGQNGGLVPYIMPRFQTGPQQWSPCGNRSSPGPVKRYYNPRRTYPPDNIYGRSNPACFPNCFDSRSYHCNWVAVDRSRPRGRGLLFNSGVSGNHDILTEQNRGPRTLRFRNQKMGLVDSITQGQVPLDNGNIEDNNLVPNREQYNRPEFQTSYPDSKFFIIKSYSEDDIHKSVKYNVWASTPNGNKKLNAAYRAAQGKTSDCPVFLFFSVNGSGQFCGVAEMVGEVDFTKSIDYWQQDKWTGSFPVKWVIIKDIPNAQLRHVTLDNNDNKPVTNSRDTQEVKPEKGTEILNIFKNYVCKTSILDDFPYYEARQIVMQQRKAQQAPQKQEQETSNSGEESGAVSLEDDATIVEESSASVENKYNTHAKLQETTDLTSDSCGSPEQFCDEGCNNLDLDCSVNGRSESSVVAGECDYRTGRKLRLDV